MRAHVGMRPYGPVRFGRTWAGCSDILLQPGQHGGAAFLAHGEGLLGLDLAFLIAQRPVPELGADGAFASFQFPALPVKTLSMAKVCRVGR